MTNVLKKFRRAGVAMLLAALAFAPSVRAAEPAKVPVYDHIVIVLEENKDYEQVINKDTAPYITGVLKAEGADLTQMYGEEHHSEGNYFWLLAGSNFGMGFDDAIPGKPIAASNMAQQLLLAGLTFKGYSEDLPKIGATDNKAGLYARKHVPWVSFSNIPNGKTVEDSSNLRWKDFPSDYTKLPTVAIVIPNLVNDMHDGGFPDSVRAGDKWLKKNLDGYYQWAKTHNSLLIITFDENAHGPSGPTDPLAAEMKRKNRIPTIIAGAHIKPGEYPEGKGVNHVTLLRTIEAMYKLPKSGGQEKHALAAGISDDFIVTDVFETKP